MTEQEFETVALKNQMREVLVNEIKGLYVAEGGFDPPTSGLWAQHASSAPLCQLPFVSFTLHITQFSADAISTSFRTISFARSNRRPFYLDKINAHLLQVVKKKHGRNTVSISNRNCDRKFFRICNSRLRFRLRGFSSNGRVLASQVRGTGIDTRNLHYMNRC